MEVIKVERKIYGRKYPDDIEAIVCVAYTNEAILLLEMDYMSQVVIFKTINVEVLQLHIQYGPRKRGAGREIINKLHEFLVNERIATKRLVTLSSPTINANGNTFHIKNGAKQISINDTTQNFEYKLNQSVDK